MSRATTRSPLWRGRRFATYWAGQGISQFGDRITELALPFIAVTTLQASAPTVGLLTAAVWAPNVLALLIGSWVDHQPRKRQLSSSPTSSDPWFCSVSLWRTGSVS